MKIPTPLLLVAIVVLAAILATFRGNASTRSGGRSAHIVRSASARRAFRRMYPCPSTGLVKGRCPGFVIDHVTPLACGGADSPDNMQWQTTADAKAKDAVERKGCAH